MYLNPLYEHDFPDPFVFKFCGEYWAICTGAWHDGGIFGVLHSRDLVNWTDRGSAISAPPIPESPFYWAPEVFYDNGKFYLYYSVGNETLMQLRVAAADAPGGKYVDSGHQLTLQDFAIDAHVFVDDDNSRWLFYATDFLDHAQIGTGTVRDRMISPFELEGNPQPVTRAKYDWQVYDPQRASKNNVRWHTVEGPFVMKRKNVYYEMFSGGNWQNISYGVSFATTRSIGAPDEWRQFSDGEKVLPILRTIPGKIVGPGHNCAVRAPDNRQLFCVYHRWADDLRGRLLAIDPMDFAGERILILGASSTPQPAPNQPTIFDFFEQESAKGLSANWICDDEKNWLINSGAAVSNANAEFAEAVCRKETNAFLVEVSHRAVGFESEQSGYGFSLKKGGATVLRCSILPGAKRIEILESGESAEIYDLPADFEPSVFHLWRIEVDNLSVRLRLDEAAFRFEKQLAAAPTNFALTSRRMSAAFAGFALTEGFEDLFERQEIDLTARGWQIEKGAASAWQINQDELRCQSLNSESAIVKNFALKDFELVVNLKSESETTPGAASGFYLKQAERAAVFLTIEQGENAQFFLQVQTAAETHRFVLPEFFAPHECMQFRVNCQNGRMSLKCETVELGEVPIENEAVCVGLYARQTAARFEMVRVTAI